MRKLLAFGFSTLVFGACHTRPASSAAPPVDEPSARGTDISIPPPATGAPLVPSLAASAKRPTKGAGLCKASSVAQGTTCPTRAIPPGTGSSPEGCKSDAECTQGRDGRCVRAWGEGAEVDAPATDARRANLFAGPPPPPPRSKCVYDECTKDKDCPNGSRCACGSGKGKDRNQCIRTDACLVDGDCGEGKLCHCGQNAAPNACQPGNCRSDADCGNGFTCETYCHSAKDACRESSDCKAPEHMIPICMYLEQTRAWGCKSLVPRPPG